MKKYLIYFLTFLILFCLPAEDLYEKLLSGNGTRYRFIDDTAALPASGGSVTVRSYLYAGEKPVSITENGQVMYLGTDLRNSVMTVTDRYGTVMARSGYDVFGYPVKADAVRLTGLGYAGKPFDFTTGLYNYGFRDYSPETGRFTSLDPIRYGQNWYAYVSNDPVNYVDLWGLINIKPVALLMQDAQWGKEVLGSSTKEKAYLIEDAGCYLTAYASAATTLTGQVYTPLDFNGDTSLFDADQNFNSTAASNITGLINDYWTQAVQGDLTDKLNELNKSETEYVVMAQVPYDASGHLHWVEVYGGVDDDGWIDIVGTSVHDYEKESRKVTDTWNFTESSVQIKASEIKQLRTFTVENTGGDSRKAE